MEQVRRRAEAEEVRRRKEETARPIAKAVDSGSVGELSKGPISGVLESLGIGSEGKTEDVSRR
jgi:hypothetical protein